MTRTAQGPAGFTLVELLIALIIFSVAVLGLASSMAAITRYQMLATNRGEMILVADSKLDELRAAGQGRTADTVQLVVGGSITTATAPYADTVTSGRGIPFAILWQVAAGPAGSRLVTLRAEPLVDSPRTPRAMDFTTLINLQ